MIVLASASPRRRELLSLLTKEFTVIPSDADETTDLKDARELVRLLACKKAGDVAKKRPGDVVIGADTVVEVSGQILGKPKDMEDATRMIRLLRDRTHTVWTGLCVLRDGERILDDCATQVTFGSVTERELADYLAREEIMDKAGAYAIQGGAAKFIERIDGCFFNVVGLPVSLLYRMLQEIGCQL